MVTEGNKVSATQADINKEIMAGWDISLVEIASLAHYLVHGYIGDYCDA